MSFARTRDGVLTAVLIITGAARQFASGFKLLLRIFNACRPFLYGQTKLLVNLSALHFEDFVFFNVELTNWVLHFAGG